VGVSAALECLLVKRFVGPFGLLESWWLPVTVQTKGKSRELVAVKIRNAVLAGALALAFSNAQALIIDFEGIAQPGDAASFNGLTLSTEGYSFQIHTGAVISSTYYPDNYNDHGTNNGTDWLMHASDHPMVMTQFNGNAFSIQSMNFNSWHISDEVTIIGEYSNGGMIIENLLFTPLLESYTFSSGWVGLSSITFVAPSANIAIDNIVVTSAVPEPETYAMMLAGLGLLGVMARRRKQKLNA